jgi:hypothetical protein
MKKLLLFCFLVSSGLMASDSDTSVDLNGIEEVVTLPNKIGLSIADHFVLQNGSLKLTEQTSNLLYQNATNSKDCIDEDRISDLMNDVSQISYSEGLRNGKALIKKYYQSFYDSGPKKAALGIVTLIVVSSVVYTGFSLFAKFKKWRKNEDTK